MFGSNKYNHYFCLRIYRKMDILNFDDYFYDVWDKVPHEVVDDRAYTRNLELIREMTFGLWDIYKNTCTIDDYGFIKTEMSTDRAAKIMTNIFENVKKIGIRI